MQFDEMLKCDLTANIDYIVKKPGQKQIYYVGHFQGALTRMLRNNEMWLCYSFYFLNNRKLFLLKSILESILIHYNYLEHIDKPKENNIKSQ